MTRYDLAFGLMDYIPLGALEQLIEIGRSRSNRKVEMNFKDGRCLEIKVTDIQRFSKEDFPEEGADNG